MPMSPRLLRPRATAALVAVDADARTYINAVRTADGGQYMEAGVQRAIDAFVIGCKADGIWSAIKASCILMGARTLSGALTPLVGSAPTNNNFVSGDYNRKTGLVGNGTSKYLDSNRNNNADPQDSKHLAVYASSTGTASGVRGFIAGGIGSATGPSQLTNLHATTQRSARAHDLAGVVSGVFNAAGFWGVSRASSSATTERLAGSNTTITAASGTRENSSLLVFARNTLTSGVDGHTDARLAFYSIGESLTLSSLDSRVSTLYTAIGAAIP